jgi:hypothetical protein
MVLALATTPVRRDLAALRLLRAEPPRADLDARALPPFFEGLPARAEASRRAALVSDFFEAFLDDFFADFPRLDALPRPADFPPERLAVFAAM